MNEVAIGDVYNCLWIKRKLEILVYPGRKSPTRGYTLRKKSGMALNVKTREELQLTNFKN